MDLTPCIGIGDLLVLKMSQVSNHLDIKKIHISWPVVTSYRQYPEQYLTFIQRLLSCLFPATLVDVVNDQHNPIPLDQYNITHRYIYDNMVLSNRIKPHIDNYIVFHTKVRMENMTIFFSHDLPILIQFLSNFKVNHDQMIVLMGERVIEDCLEQKTLNIISLYQELLSLLRNNNNVVDLTKEMLYSGNPDYGDFEKDVNIIHHANLNISFGIGGNNNLCHSFSHKNISFVGPLNTYLPVIGGYPDTYQTIEPFLAQVALRSNAVDNLIIMVIACATIPKYRDYILKIEETWGKHAREMGVKVLHFLGEEPTDLVGDQYIYLKGVSNDYVSASYKQNLGLKYIYDHYNTKYVFCCGSDTYVNTSKMLELLQKYNHQERIFLGGHILSRVTHNRSLLSFSGGGGFIISRPLIGAMYHQLDRMVEEWTNFTTSGGNSYLIPACDVCIGYYAEMHQAHMICYQDRLTGCNHHGQPACCVGKVRHNRLVTCHNMSLPDFDQFTQILTDQKYFMSESSYPRQVTPNCTVVTVCLSVEALPHLSVELMKSPCFMVIYCHSTTMQQLINMREHYGNTYPTVYYYLPLSGETVSSLTKYQLMYRTMKINPFDTDKFMWVDPNLGLSTTQILNIADNVTDNFHYYVTHLVPGKSTKYEYGYSISTRLFTFGYKIGNLILTTLLERMTQSTDADQLHTVIIEQYSDQIVKSHGTEELIADNFLYPMKGHIYLYNSILNEYQGFRAYQDACQIGAQLVSLMERRLISIDPDTWMRILYAYYVSAYYKQSGVASELVKLISDWRKESHLFEKAYQEKPGFYDEQLSFVKYLQGNPGSPVPPS